MHKIALLLSLLAYTSGGAQLDSLAFVPDNAPLSFRQVHTPPDFGICAEQEDYAACVNVYLMRKFGEIKTRMGYAYNPPDTLASQYYFEISADGKIENVRVTSNYKLNDIIVEHVLSDSIKVKAPARDASGVPIRSFWYDRFYSVYSRNDMRKSSEFRSWSQNLQVKKIAPQTYRHISFLETESWGKVACNGLVIVKGDEALVLDTPVSNEASEELLEVLTRRLRLKVVGVVATHFHEDCLGGLQAFHDRGITSFGIGRTLALAEEAGHIRPKAAISGKRSFYLSDTPVQLAFFGAGHTEDNIVVYFPEDKVLFGGCLVKALGAGKGNLEDADVAAWPETIRKVMEAFPEAEVVVPGHGEPGGPELLEYTRELFGGR